MGISKWGEVGRPWQTDTSPPVSARRQSSPFLRGANSHARRTCSFQQGAQSVQDRVSNSRLWIPLKSWLFPGSRSYPQPSSPSVQVTWHLPALHDPWAACCPQLHRQTSPPAHGKPQGDSLLTDVRKKTSRLSHWSRHLSEDLPPLSLSPRDYHAAYGLTPHPQPTGRPDPGTEAVQPDPVAPRKTNPQFTKGGGMCVCMRDIRTVSGIWRQMGLHTVHSPDRLLTRLAPSLPEAAVASGTIDYTHVKLSRL